MMARSSMLSWYTKLIVAWLCCQFIAPHIDAKAKRVASSISSRRGNSNKDGHEGFEMLAKYACRYASGKTTALRDYNEEDAVRAVNALASAQQAWKSVDGVTHSLKNTFKESTSLQSRFYRFLDRKSKNTKEAVKLFEYITTVERGLQTCEVLQAAAMEDELTRHAALHEAGLREVHRFQLSENKIQLSASLCIPLEEAVLDKRFQKNEVVICIVDRVNNKQKIVQTVSRWLRLATVDKQLSVPVGEDLSLELQPTVLSLAVSLAKQLKPHLQQLTNLAPSHNTSVGVAADLSDNLTAADAGPGVRRLKLCVLGHSTGGAVAAYLSMMLDGFLNRDTLTALCDIDAMSTTEGSENRNSDADTDPEIIYSDMAKTDSFPLIGRYRRRVICRLLGPPPCIGRAIVPRFVTSIVCGDDIIPRATYPALRGCQTRILQALESGAGRKNMAWLATPSLLKDISKVAGSNLKKYKGRKKAQAGLQLPGRVFFIKSRQLKQGATIQRILRGNWQEEVLWSIHDIVISQKMLDHHSLDAYIRTLNRC